MNDTKKLQASDRSLYKKALCYLKNLLPHGISEKDLYDYLTAPSKTRPKKINGIYQRILISAQNANMKRKVIGDSINGIENLGSVLGGFSPKSVCEKYGNDSEQLLRVIMRELKPDGKVRKTNRSIWPQYCRTILSAAAFMERFKSANDFYKWVDFFDLDDRVRPGLPLILSQEIPGMGFALACDFLKELGYAKFGKPDVHIRDIFQAAGLCDKLTSDYQLLRTLCRVADHANVSAYEVDKVFWLIGSGDFYNHSHIGKKGRIPSPKAGFLAILRDRDVT